MDIMKSDLLLVKGWCPKEILRVNSNETALIQITRKRITSNLNGIKLSGETLLSTNN